MYSQWEHIGLVELDCYSGIRFGTNNVEPLTMLASKCVFIGNRSGKVECYYLMLLQVLIMIAMLPFLRN